MSQLTHQIVADTVSILGRLRTRSPRVQCLTNTVAQPITANVLLAIGARVSMATHSDEVIAMTGGADALLINLGTLDQQRIDAIPRLLAHPSVQPIPRVLDPVFIQFSPLRKRLAREVVDAAGRLLVKGNTGEMAALDLPAGHARVETGEIDLVGGLGQSVSIHNGHRWMADVTGMGCALGAVIAACMAVEMDPIKAATSAVLAFGVAGEVAAQHATGPGSFAVAFIDAMSQLDEQTLGARARVT